MYDQMYSCFNPIFSKYQCVGFVLDCLLPMTEKKRACVDDDQMGGAIIIDLHNALDYINYELPIAKRVVLAESLNFIQSYLTGRKQRISSNHTSSSY